MQVRWVQKSGMDRVLVVFGGWALGWAPFAHLKSNCDIVFAEDYRDLSDTLDGISNYQIRDVVAFSYGVSGFAFWQDQHAIPFDRKVAVNGTLTPVSDQTGIAKAIFQKTHDTLETNTFQLFMRRAYEANQTDTPIDIPARKAELKAIEARGAAPDPGFDRIWISTKDRIIPTSAQRRAWAASSNTRDVDAPHVPFAAWQSWDEVLA